MEGGGDARSASPLRTYGGSLRYQISHAVALSPLDYLRRFGQHTPPAEESFSAPTEDSDAAQGITYRHRAPRRSRRVQSTQRLAARGYVRVSELLQAE